MPKKTTTGGALEAIGDSVEVVSNDAGGAEEINSQCAAAKPVATPARIGRVTHTQGVAR